MKLNKDPVTYADVEMMLVRAAHATNLRCHVITGSLSVIGTLFLPLSDKVDSRNLDTFPLTSPDKGFVEVAACMGKYSEFHQEFGLYVKPTAPKLLDMPSGWETRLTSLTMSENVTGMFADLNDVAIGKLMRNHLNDLQWAKAGFAEGVLNADIIRDRARTVPASQEKHAMLKANLALMTGTYGE